MEERFAQRLGSNDLPVRNKALKRLSKWVEERSALKDGFTEMELLKLWKGLHVCMWHSDKPLVQAELADNIAKLIHVFRLPDRALQFVSAFFTTIAREWVGIDRLRLDKYYTLIRKIVSHSFRFLHQNSWNKELVVAFSALMSEGPFNNDTVKACLGVQLHVLEVFLVELRRVVEACPEKEACPGMELLMPVFSLLAGTTNSIVVECIETSIVSPLQTDKTVQKLNVRGDLLSQRLRDLAIDRTTVGKNRKKLYALCKRFSDFHEQEDKQNVIDTPPDLRPPRKKKTKRKLKK